MMEKNIKIKEYEALKNRMYQIQQEVNEPKLPEKAYLIIRKAIRELILKPGDTILEREMADFLDMSRTPIREALVRLEKDEMVRLIPRRGVTIKPIEAEDLREIYSIAGALDGLAVEQATPKLIQADILLLEEMIEKQERALNENELHNWAILDDNFHSMIITFAQNDRLNRLIEIHADHLYRARLYTVHQRPLPHNSILEHKAIVASMKAEDGQAARTLVQSHRHRASREILKALESELG